MFSYLQTSDEASSFSFCLQGPQPSMLSTVSDETAVWHILLNKAASWGPEGSLFLKLWCPLAGMHLGHPFLSVLFKSSMLFWFKTVLYIYRWKGLHLSKEQQTDELLEKLILWSQNWTIEMSVYWHLFSNRKKTLCCQFHTSLSSTTVLNCGTINTLSLVPN